jgi:hypothetical protein
MSLTPVFEYVHPTNVEGRIVVGRIDIGAYELNGGVPLGDGGIDSVDAGTFSGNPDGGSAPGSPVNGASGDGSGCGCKLAGDRQRETPWFFSIGIAIAFALRRAQRRRHFVKQRTLRNMH